MKACDGTMRPEEADKLAQKHLEAGRSEAMGGRHQDAMKSFRAAIRCREGLGEAHFHLALELQRGGELKQAVDAMQRAAALSPAIAGDAFFQVGYWRSQSGDGEGALDGFSRAVKADPQNAQAWSNLGVIQQQMGRFPAALEAYKKSTKANPKNAQNFFNTGKVYQDLGQVKEAVDAFRRAVDTSPTYFEAYASLGGALTPMRRWKDASAILTDALLLEPRSPEALYLLAFAQMHICQWEELEKVLTRLHDAVRARLSSAQNPGVEPYASLTFPWGGADLRAIAEYHARVLASAQSAALGHTPQWSHATLNTPTIALRIAIKSYDIGDHQSSYLMSSVLGELATRNQQILLQVFCLRPNDGSVLRQSIEEAVGSDKFFDVSALPTIDVAEKINNQRVHVLVDMDAHFRNSRMQLMSLLPAPVQVLYPFFVGTSVCSCAHKRVHPHASASAILDLSQAGRAWYFSSHSQAMAPGGAIVALYMFALPQLVSKPLSAARLGVFLVCVFACVCVRARVSVLQGADYLPLAFNDKVATPPDYARFFSEKLIYLPNSYYVNSHLTSFDAQVTISKEPCKRAL